MTIDTSGMKKVEPVNPAKSYYWLLCAPARTGMGAQFDLGRLAVKRVLAAQADRRARKA